jgi:2-haloacid dehalogenase
MMQEINTIVFDLGGVLIDWNPRYLYRKIFKTEEEITWFLQNICTGAWNDQQDAGRPFEEATEELLKKFPDYEVPIRAYYGRWKETMGGALNDTVDILRSVRDMKTHRLYALTNWSKETFPWALENFEFLHWFEGIVVSGIEKTRKPFPEIYDILINRYQFEPHKAVFIDDNLKNIEAAKRMGFITIHFQSAGQLKEELKAKGILE